MFTSKDPQYNTKLNNLTHQLRARRNKELSQIVARWGSDHTAQWKFRPLTCSGRETAGKRMELDICGVIA